MEKFLFENREAYLKKMDSLLPDDFKQVRNVGSGTHVYYPHVIKEAVADMMFRYWNIVDEKYAIMVNELVCTVKVVFLPDYPDAQEQSCTGSASTPIQMDSGAKPSDFPAKKKINSLEYNLPSVRTEAVSNAFHSLGNIFGRNLNRLLNSKDKVSPDFSFRAQKRIQDEQNGI
jgi:hypothetical protein